MHLIRPARPEEFGELTELAIRSKGHWGYDAEFLEGCRPELTVRPDRHRPTVAEVDGRVAGFAVVTGEPPEGELDMLFVDTWAIRRGVGRALFEHAVATPGFESLRIESDPQAEEFYLRMGAVRIGEAVSPSTGRSLPLLRVTRPLKHG